MLAQTLQMNPVSQKWNQLIKEMYGIKTFTDNNLNMQIFYTRSFI